MRPLAAHTAGTWRCPRSLRLGRHGARSRALLSGLDDDGPSPWDGSLSGAHLSAAQDVDWSTAPHAEPVAGSSLAELAAADSERYGIEQLVGAGGMGRVHRAVDTRLDREVAIKRLARSDGRLAERLAREARITAQLNHPAIIAVFNAGIGSDGQPYYTMPLLRGRSFDRVLADADSLTERLRYLRPLLQVAEAVGYAHSRGVVHRDLKPSNIVLGGFGETLVVDWGLARNLDGEARTDPADTDPAPAAPSGPAPSAQTSARGAVSAALTPTTAPISHQSGDTLTRVGAIIGTPRYMSPEQAVGTPATPTSDVWALGCVLYELVAGSPAQQGSSEDALARLRRGEATTPLVDRVDDAPRELVAIIERAMATAPGDRYPTAAALATDLEAYLDGRRVNAHNYSTADALRRFWRRWWLPTTAVVLGLLGVIAALVWGYTEADAERDRAVEAEQLASEARDQSVSAETESRGHLARSLSLRAANALHAQDDAEALALAASAIQYSEEPQARGVLASVALDLAIHNLGRYPLPPKCRNPNISRSGDRVMCRYGNTTTLWTLDADAGNQPLIALRGQGCVYLGDGSYAACSVFVEQRADARPNDQGDIVVVNTATGIIELYHDDTRLHGKLDAETHSTQWAIKARSNDPTLVDLATGSLIPLESMPDRIKSAGFSRTGDVLVTVTDTGAVVSGPPDGPRQFVGRLPDDEASLPVAVSNDGRRAAFGTTSGRFVVAELHPWRIVRDELTELGSLTEIRFSPDNSMIAADGDAGGVDIRHGETGALLARIPRELSRNARWLDDTTLATTTKSEWLSWNIWGDMLGPRRFAFDAGLASLAISPDGSLVAAALGHGVVDVRDIDSDASVLRIDIGVSSVVKSVAFTPDGEFMAFAIAGIRETFRVYRAKPPFERVPIEPMLGSKRAVHALPDGRFVAVSYGPAADIIDPRRQRPTEQVRLPFTPLHQCLSPSGDRMLILAFEGVVPAMELSFATGKTTRLEVADGTLRCSYSPDGKQLLLASLDRAGIYTRDGELVREFAVPAVEDITALAWFPESLYISLGTRTGKVMFFNPKSGKLMGAAPVATKQISGFAIRNTEDTMSRVFASSWDEHVYRLGSYLAFGPPEAIETFVSSWGLPITKPSKAWTPTEPPIGGR